MIRTLPRDQRRVFVSGAYFGVVVGIVVAILVQEPFPRGLVLALPVGAALGLVAGVALVAGRRRR